MSSIGPGGDHGEDEVGDHGGSKITTLSNSTRISHETKVISSKQSEISLLNTSKNQHENLLHHHHHHHHKQQPQQHLLLSRHDCNSNQYGSDSGLGYTNSISSENSSLIVNTTSLEQNNTYSNTNSANNNQDAGALKIVNNSDKATDIQITDSDSFNNETQNSACSNNDSAISCIENGSTDAASISIPNKAASINDLGGNVHGIDSQRLRISDKQLVKSAKVAEGVNNNVKTNQDNSLLSSSLSKPRTKDELCGQEAFFDTSEKSLANSAKVISNIDDEAKIKHSSRRRADQSASSTIRPREDNDELDKTGELSLDHDLQDACARLSDADQPSLKINPIVSLLSSSVPPPIKSSLKKTGDRSLEGTTKAKHNRHVSFNQTVIVFCEEIDTSSPSETFEPPLDYQDAPAADEHQSLPGNLRGASNKDIKSQNTFVNDDFDILSKIVGDDASSLTDDQLFGLLENGSLLKKFDLDEGDKTFTVDRLHSDQSYLCHDAISDSESESSLTIDAHYKEMVINKSTNPSAKSKEATPNLSEASQSSRNQFLSKNGHERSTNHTNSQSADCCHDSHVGPILPVQQRLVPARVKVSTVDSNLKRQHKSNPLDEVDSSSHTIGTCPKVIQTPKRNTAKSEPMLVRLTNVEPAIFSKPQLKDNISEINIRRQPPREPEKDGSQTVAARPSFTSNSQMISDDQISSRENRLTTVDQHDQEIRDMSSTQHKTLHAPNQPSNVHNAQVIQGSQACHICRAIESKFHQSEFGTRDDRTSLMTHNGSALHSNRMTVDQQQSQKTAYPHQYHGSGSTLTESQHQKQLQLVPTSQLSCVSCRESTVREQQNCVAQQPRPNLANNLDHQQVRPIACQLVYVVDQCGNRMKALQVVGPAQMGPHNNQSMRPIMIVPENSRLSAPSAGQNLIRMSNPGQILGVVRSAPVQVNTNNPQAMNSNHGVQHVPIKESFPSVVNQQQRMQLVSHSAPRNHTVYYVRQPLGSQDFRQSVGSSTNPVPRSFPDVHEIRRLDGIRAPTESPSLIQTNHAITSPGQSENIPNMLHQSKMDNRSLKLRRDDSEDPTFGFSRRPAVKVVTNAMHESQMQAVGKTNSNNFNQAASSNHQRLLSGSLTLDRKSVNRDQSSHREAKENIPSTSSMSNINKTLTNYVASNNHRYENNSKPKETNVGQVIDRKNKMQNHQTDGFVHPRQDRKDQDRPEVAYAMNI